MQIDTIVVAELIYLERHLRDKGRWDEMKELYHPESLVRVAWFEGNGHAFVEASKELHRAGLSKHRLSPSIVRVNGSRAVAETDTVIETRVRWGDVEVDTAANCRLLSMVRKDKGAWRIASLDCIYEKDMVRPVNPTDVLPIDATVLQTFRPSYRFISYNLHSLGRNINAHLPGDDQPELVNQLYAEADAWLAG